jgi:hypothetical protein
MKYICLKISTGEELVGTTESEHNDEVINIEDPIRIVPGHDDEGNYGLRLTTFMPFVEDSLFTFKRKDVILYNKPTENLIEYYKDYIDKRNKAYQQLKDEEEQEAFEARIVVLNPSKSVH